MKKLAVTGATGLKSGGAFIGELAQNAEQIKRQFPDGIRTLVRAASDTSVLERTLPEAEICRGDFSDVTFLVESLRGVDTLVHIAGIHSSREVVCAAAEAGVRRLILVHTTGIYSRYKEAGEEYRQTDAIVYETCKKKRDAPHDSPSNDDLWQPQRPQCDHFCANGG